VLRAAGYNVGLGYNEDQRQLQLMDGWQASEHGGPTCVQNIS